ncbi:hypothetical protein B484DRAFT_394775 [Ochromonadaceae sp. CCMP2298]|nr:hypothetical protein B484DRAFT_394775 [Ochromonadaceae sp. CCMP2298]
MTEDDLTKGRLHLQVYRSDYTKDKFTLDQNNILKASYAHWTATKKPVFVTFSENMYSMLRTGEFVVSGKLLSSAPMDKGRTEEAWLVERRHNVIIVGPAGCGKSCLIQTLTLKYGVQYFGTADELREIADDVQFVVFDDFDFSTFTAADMKRLLDREF